MIWVSILSARRGSSDANNFGKKFAYVLDRVCLVPYTIGYEQRKES
jgi:hypothetical protein